MSYLLNIFVDVDGQITQPVGVAAVFIVIPAENLGMNHRHFQHFVADALDETFGQIRNMRKINRNESGSGVIELAYNDPLTGLPNRKLMMDRLEQAIVSAKRRSTPLALLFVDLDEFKEVNDAYGHKTGDQLLIEIANKLRDFVRRENDTIARIGGDEFLILLTDISQRSHIESVIQLLFEKFTEPLSIGSPPVKVKVNLSIGVALFPEHGETSDTLIHNADSAMYKVKKKRKKNHFCFFEP